MWPYFNLLYLETVKTAVDLQYKLDQWRSKGAKIGFVPTMGALHAGHVSLIDKALSENDVVVCSIFVNPTQFNDPSDLVNYPRPIEKDVQLLNKSGCQLLFLPEVEELYKPGETWDHAFGRIETVFEGAFRPGHFKGVGQIVKKLFDIVKPDQAYFGQKDYQQFLIVQKLVYDFDIPVKLTACPIVREADGLAMSSRNIRLEDTDRKNAPLIYQTLAEVKKQFTHKTIQELLMFGREKLEAIPNVQLEYFDIVDGATLITIQKAEKHEKIVALAAVRLGKTRLIDNMILKS